ncbi:MAG: PepSY domain-containing protein [Dongiaceae bacterium]
MQWKAGIFAFAALAMVAAGPAWAACSAGDTIDGSTAAEAKNQIEAAGYEQVRVLKKGCDNYWHGTARKDGAAVNVVLSPQGEVVIEGS